jgi:hypothetical protein
MIIQSSSETISGRHVGPARAEEGAINTLRITNGIKYIPSKVHSVALYLSPGMPDFRAAYLAQWTSVFIEVCQTDPGGVLPIRSSAHPSEYFGHRQSL